MGWDLAHELRSENARVISRKNPFVLGACSVISKKGLLQPL
jgi:hypothetical protein